jgi:integrase
MNRRYQSIYAEHIGQFIAIKKSLGFKYNTEGVILSLFDQLCYRRKESKVGISKQLWEAWILINPNESSSYRYHRAVCVAQLSQYLNQEGIRSLMPQLPPNKNSFTPYIFSRSQIASFLQAADGMVARKRRMDSVIFSLPCLWRILYGTGIRISEALALLEKDVNTKDRYLLIRDAKNGLERMVPMTDSLTEVCCTYRSYKTRLPIRPETNTPFLVSLDGSACKHDAVHNWFQKTLSKAGIVKCEHGPRIHDLRHSFSVHSLAMLAESGQDIYCSLPILSTYLGHQSLESTNGYVRLTDEMYPGLIKDVELVCLNVFPKLTDHDTH